MNDPFLENRTTTKTKWMLLATLAIVFMLTLASCASRAGDARLATNAWSEPLFHDSGFFALGGEVAFSQTSLPHADTSGHSISPVIQYKKALNPWCSFNLLPVNFDFLLSGSQFDSAGTPVEKSNVLFNIGLTGVSYHPDEGFSPLGAASIQVKTIHSQRLFTEVGMEAASHDVSSLEEWLLSGTLTFGLQIFPSLSLASRSQGRFHVLAPNRIVREQGISFSDRDLGLLTEIEATWYATPRNRVALYSGMLTKNGGQTEELAVYEGLRYTHAF